MADFNRVILMGRLTRDPELRYTPNGTAVANLSLAVNRRWKGDNQTKEETSFFDIVVFGKQAENCSEYLGKGRAVLIEGRLQQRRWETDDGQKRNKVEVVASNVQFLGSGKPDTSRPSKEDDSSPPEFDDNDIPF